MNTFVEYLAPDGARWRVERGEELVRVFGIEGDAHATAVAVGELHRALAGSTQAWTVIRRTYAFWAQLGTDDPNDMVPASMEDIARELDLPLGEVESLAAQALVLWKRRKAASARVEDSAEDRTELTVAEQQRLVQRFGFPGDLPDAERGFLANRVQDLATVLENDNLRGAVRAMLQDELNLFFVIDVAIRDCKPGTPSAQHDKLLKLLTTRREIQGSILNAMKELGISDLVTGMKKKLRAQDSLGGMVRAMQMYYADGDRRMVDGVFEELEIELQVTDYDIRPAQYRPELAMIVPEAIERLFDPTYEPPQWPRKAHRRLKKAFLSALKAAREEDGEEQPELEEDDTSEE